MVTSLRSARIFAVGVLVGLATTPLRPAHADDPKRTRPDYEGRPPAPTTPGEVARWGPRILFSPIYFTTEYLIRLPIGALEVAAERSNVPRALYDFFTFGPNHKAGFAPIAFVDFGFNPSVGIYTFWDDAFFKGDDLRLHVSGWPSDWLGGSAVQRIRFHHDDEIALKFVGIRRPDHAFYGTGPRTLESSQSRYGEDMLDGAVTAAFRLWRSSKVETGVGVRYASFNDGHYGSDPGIIGAVSRGFFPLPDGFSNGYTAQYNHVLAAIDTRLPFPSDGTGFRLEAEGDEGNDVGQFPGSGWLRWQAAAGGFLDLDGHRRIVSLSFEALFSDPLGSRPVPFTELVSLGGDAAPMPGFFPGRMIDRSGAVATLRYRWPIGPWLDGSMQAAVGNVYGAHLDDFDPRLLRLSAALGLESDSSPDSNFQLLLGMGTETFEHGAQVDSFRLAFGTSRGL
jgi:hypothetical protein